MTKKKTSPQRAAKKPAPKPAEKPAAPAFSVGQCVAVKPGTMDPDTGLVDLDGWQGRITSIEQVQRGKTTIMISWDSATLRNMPESMIAYCEEEGLDWTEMGLYAHELEPAACRDTEADVTRARDEITAQSEWLYLGEQGERIQAVVGGEDEADAVEAWADYLEQTLTFPFDAVVAEFQERGPLRGGDRVRVTGITAIDDHYGLVVSVKKGLFWKYDFQLCDLEAVDRTSPNHDVIEDYRTWFANRQ